MMRPLRLSLAVSMLALTGAANSADLPLGNVQSLSYGITPLDLTGAGLPSMAVLARRENGNAHGFDVLTLYVSMSLWDGDPVTWRIVPVFDTDNNDSEQLTLLAGGGADCLLHDFRLVASSRERGLQLVVAERRTGDFATAAPITFKFYELEKPTLPFGWPPYYFQLTHSSVTQRSYCDVGEAFEKELGLRPSMARPR
jgi:hypothetical protein